MQIVLLRSNKVLQRMHVHKCKQDGSARQTLTRHCKVSRQFGCLVVARVLCKILATLCWHTAKVCSSIFVCKTFFVSYEFDSIFLRCKSCLTPWFGDCRKSALLRSDKKCLDHNHFVEPTCTLTGLQSNLRSLMGHRSDVEQKFRFRFDAMFFANL